MQGLLGALIALAGIAVVFVDQVSLSVPLGSLALIFGGYRKGTVVNAPSPTSPVPSHTLVHD